MREWGGEDLCEVDEDEKEWGYGPQTRGSVWIRKNAGIRGIRAINDPENKEGCSRMRKTCYNGCFYHHGRIKDRKQLKGERIYFGSWLKVSQRGWFDSGSRSSGYNSWGVCFLTSGWIRKQKWDAGNVCYLSLFFLQIRILAQGGVLPTFSVGLASFVPFRNALPVIPTPEPH